ncbi:MAG TPA: GntR family transcriptional regulator, partial [Polyangiaceae bacterium]|nr:GntR family transcriptional regulator [Polyangiaceae bacterium]
MRKWELLTLELDPHRAEPLFLQLSNAIADDIRSGRLKAGDALPGTRVLAERAGVHRNTIIAGYKELMAQGLVCARSGGGTFVAERTNLTPHAPAAAPSSQAPTYALAPPLPPRPMAPPDPPGMLVMVRGVPDVRLLPAEAMA